MEESKSIFESIEVPSDIEKVFIIGKGQSIDEIKNIEKILDDKTSLVINLNDSFSIIPGSIAVIGNNSCKGNFVSADTDRIKTIISDEKIEPLPTVQLEWDNTISLDHQRCLDQMRSDKLKLHKFSLITALHLCVLISRKVDGEIKVYLLGIDFLADYSLDALRNKRGQGLEYGESFLSSQQRFFEQILPNLAGLGLSVRHVGSLKFSWMTPTAFSAFIGRVVNASITTPNTDKMLNSSVSEQDYNVIIVAEITTNHFGDKDRLLSMISAAANAGANMVKLQCRDVESFYSAEELGGNYMSPFGTNFGDYRKALELSDDDFETVDNLCSKLNIEWFVSVLDFASYNRMKKFKLGRIKLPSTISDHRDFLKSVASEFRGELVLSTGYTDSNYEKFVLEHFSEVERLYLLQCTSAYPTPDEDAQIAVVRHYTELSKKYKNLIPGYSSHDVGSLGCQLAVAAGAQMIEKHVRFGSVGWAHFDDVAIDLSDGSFDKFVDDVRRAEVLLGTGKKQISSSEHHKYWLK